MTKLRSLCAALALSLMLASAVLAGDIQTPGKSDPPPPPPGQGRVSAPATTTLDVNQLETFALNALTFVLTRF